MALSYGLAAPVGGYAAYTHNPNDPYSLSAGIGAGLLAGRRYVNATIASRVAQMLTSNDPAMLAKGMKIAASNKAIMDSFRNWGSSLSAPIVQGAGRAMPSIQGAIPGRADENQPSP